jgi:hypothetical protein
MDKFGNGEQGTILLVVLFIATAIAGLAAISSGRVVSETRKQRVLESETQAVNAAFAQIHVAMNIVNNSAYDEQNHNLVLRDAVASVPMTITTESATETTNNGQSKNTAEPTETVTTTELYPVEPTHPDLAWMDAPEDPPYGVLPGTEVRVYYARDYIQRLQRLNGDPIEPVDPEGLSQSYFVLEAAGRSGSAVRLVSALVRENQPFSSFVFFQNRATLGISGKPRGLIHANEDITFYFPDGFYQDPVSSVDGFGFMAGATPANTNILDGNPSAREIVLEEVDFEDLRSKADLFVGEDGLDADVHFQRNGNVAIQQWTPPRFEEVERSYTYNAYAGWHWETVVVEQQQQVGTQQVAYEEQVLDHYETETSKVWQNVQVGETTETRYRTETVQVGTQTVEKTREEPIYDTRTVTKTRLVKVWQPYSGTDAGGGTTVAGGGTGELGEYVWVEEPYEVEETYVSGYNTVPYTVEEPVYETKQVPYEVTVPVYEKQKVTVTTEVPVYVTVTKYREEPIYETVEIEQKKKVYDYEERTVTWTEEVWQHPVNLSVDFVAIDEGGGTIFIDGRIVGLHGEVNGRVTIVGNEKIRITSNIRYVDDTNDSAMLNGTKYTEKYVRNPRYDGRNVLGVIARDDIVFAHTLPSSAELNGTLLAVNGRVGIDGFWADESGELHIDSDKARRTYLTDEQYQKERAYDRKGEYRTRTYIGNSLRRIGGIISNNRIMETYVTTDKDGMSNVTAGYKRGSMKFDLNMLRNPPPNFITIPRPVMSYSIPVLAIRDRY